MSLFNLKDVRNHPRRSAFDLSSKVAFTAKAGELLPVRWYFTMPGDKFTLKHQHFTRTQPVNTSAYTRIREYYDWFYVPLHLLWRHAPEVISQMQKNTQHANNFTAGFNLGNYLPCLTSLQLDVAIYTLNGKTNFFGYDRGHLAAKLIQYLRFGNFARSSSVVYGTSITPSSSGYNQERKWDLSLSVFPLLAYKKFCQDYFRYSQWQISSPYLYNIDYYDGASQSLLPTIPSESSFYWTQNTLFDLEYCNWNKDIFMGILPDTQYGDVSEIPTQSLGDGAGLIDVVAANLTTGRTQPVAVGLRNTTSNNYSLQVGSSGTDSLSYTNQLLKASIDASAAGSFDVLALRRGEALQRWKEISLNVPQNYRAQIKAHFGVDVGEYMSGMSTYIGGSASSLDISEVVNTNLRQGETDSEAVIAGKGVGSGSSTEHFTANDYGVLMCIYHAVPLLDYVSTAPDPQLFLSQNTDLPIPELDSIGMQSLPISMVTNSPYEYTYPSSDSNKAGMPSYTLGYLPRYFQWKTSYDIILGAFTTTEKEWVAPITSDIWKNMLSTMVSPSPVFTYNFFKVNPAVLNSIFQVNVDSTWDTDQFLINCALDVKVVRNLDYSGMPY